MKKILSISGLLILTCSVASAQGGPLGKAFQGAGRIATQTERNLTRSISRGPLKPNPISTATIKAANFTYRPIDQLRHSISAQTALVGSEKKEAFVTQSMTPKDWLKQQKANYYSAEERERFRNIITTKMPRILHLRPDIYASDYAMEDYIYKQAPKLDAYLAPLFKGIIKDELEANKQVIAYISGAAFSQHEHRLVPQQLNVINNYLLRVMNSSGKLLNFLPHDPYLKEVNECYSEIFRIMNPLLSGAVKQAKIDRPDGREFKFNEFLLFNAEGKDYVVHSPTPWTEQVAEEVGSLHYLAERAQRESVEILKELPPNLHIAVLNDDIEPLQNFTKWAKEGHLGENAKVSAFEDGNDLLKSIRSGIHYDLIITDIYVPNGGRGMMPILRRLDEKVPVIAMSKCSRQKAGVLNLFETGMDGYLPYTPVLNDPEVGYLEFLRAFNNHLHFKNTYGWSR